MTLAIIPLLGLSLTAQAIQAPIGAVVEDTVTVRASRSTTATLAVESMQIDGRDDENVWREAPAITDFLEWRPTEGKAPLFRTEARIAYDPANLYVFIRAHDPRPDSIVAQLERRDSFTPSDMFWVWVDSFHDRRTGYEFGVNAAGVKIDLAVSNDGNEDSAWDGVWDVKTRVDSLGWTAEYRIPLSQMHYPSVPEHSFGIMIGRDVARLNVRYSWPLLRMSANGFASQWGDLEGLRGLQSPRPFEAMPYVVARNAPGAAPDATGRSSNLAFGGDLKYRIASNLVLDATVNPDFGQVEADPSVLNLSAFETFYDERRPFFVSGRGLFDFGLNCSAVNCSGESLYYSRRIGRTPELAGVYESAEALEPVTILGASKLIGRFPGGFTLGVLDAVTQRSASQGDTTFSPSTNFAVVRATQDLREGNSTFGAMLTAVNRRMDSWTSPYLPSSAYAGAVDFRHRMFGNRYQVSGSIDRSLVRGSPEVIRSLQRNGVHQYQRPDADLPYDENATELAGDAEELRFGKIAGQRMRFESALMRRSAGFDVNDLGYLRRADQTSWMTWMGLFDRRQTRYYNRLQWNNNWMQSWTTGGLPLEMAYNTNAHIQFRNNWSMGAGATFGRLGETYDDRAARGGPAVRQDGAIQSWVYVEGDSRRAVSPGVEASYARSEGGRSRSWDVGPGASIRFAGRVSANLNVNWSHNTKDNQWFGNFTDDDEVLHYTFAHLEQRTTSLTARINYTISPDASLQAYVQPFISKGTYTRIRELSDDPRAAAYEDRYLPYEVDEDGDFNVQEMRSNVVFRWEYMPGSALFMVWNQGRSGDGPLGFGRTFRDDVSDLFGHRASNTFMLKVSYWLNR